MLTEAEEPRLGWAPAPLGHKGSSSPDSPGIEALVWSRELWAEGTALRVYRVCVENSVETLTGEQTALYGQHQQGDSRTAEDGLMAIQHWPDTTVGPCLSNSTCGSCPSGGGRLLHPDPCVQMTWPSQE